MHFELNKKDKQMVLMDFIVKNDLLGAITGLQGMVDGKKSTKLK